MKILVTGASGFIGSAMVRDLAVEGEHSVVALVRQTDIRNLCRLTSSQAVQDGINNGKVRLQYGDLLGDLSGLCEGCDIVVNFAARTFVDHSIRDPWPFIEANVIGTYKLLEDARRNKVKRYIQISTDEVYGAIQEGAYKEDARLNPTNPYSASKSGADALAVCYTHTFGLWTAVTRTENNYGPWQNPQKAFPVFVKKLLKNEKIPVYGDGKHRRQWLWVDDHVSAVKMLFTVNVDPGQIFHVAGSQELENLELAKRIIEVMPGYRDSKDCIEFIEDHDIRPGHDRRYALECQKMKALGWQPKVGLDRGIKEAVTWYVANQWWLE